MQRRRTAGLRLLCALAILGQATALETNPFRIGSVAEFAATIHAGAENPRAALHIRTDKVEEERALEFRCDPNVTLVLGIVCLLDEACSSSKRAMGGDLDCSSFAQAMDTPSLAHLAENSGEILPALREIIATMPMTRHEFGSADHQVQRAVFGDGPGAVEVIINAGVTEFRHKTRLGGDVVLPVFGFVVEGPAFVAFHASRWAGVDYDVPALFTLRSLDGQALAISRCVRIFHAFGDALLNFAGAIRHIERRAIVTTQLTSQAAP